MPKRPRPRSIQKAHRDSAWSNVASVSKKGSAKAPTLISDPESNVLQLHKARYLKVFRDTWHLVELVEI